MWEAVQVRVHNGRLASVRGLYESEGWRRVGDLHHALDEETMLDLWVYVSPESLDA